MAITQPAVTEQRNGPSTKQNHVTNVTRVHADADGIIRLTESHGALKSVDVADVDLVLGFADGSYIIIPNGALDALEVDAPKIEFDGDKFNTSLTELFQQVGTVDAADAGNLRIISENIDTRLTELQPDEIDYASLFMALNNHTSAPTAPAAPLPQAPTLPQAAQVQRGSINGRGNNSGEMIDAIVPPRIDQPSTYRLGNRVEQGESAAPPLNPEYNGLPVLSGRLFVNSEFKTGDNLAGINGTTNAPVGSRPDLTGLDQDQQKAVLDNAATPANQATRQIIQGGTGDDIINLNNGFAAETQWNKTFYLNTNGIDNVDAITITLTGDKPAGFDLRLNGQSLASGTDTWTIPASALQGATGWDIEIVYDLTPDGTPVDIKDFVLRAEVLGDIQSVGLKFSENFYFRYKDATSADDFNVSVDGKSWLVLPANGIGYDIETGNGNNLVNAGAGNDKITGGSGNDTINGGAGNDTIDSGGGNNILNGGSGNDLIISRDGNNTIDGGTGTDTVEYVTSHSVHVDLRVGETRDLTNSDNNTNLKDTLSYIENIVGSGGNDLLIGNSTANSITGGAGNDTIQGIGGGDTLNGGNSGSNTVSYVDATANVAVNLATGTGQITGLAGDQLSNFDSVIGALNHANTITGNDNANHIIGGNQNDLLNGGAGNDTLFGGDGNDTLIGGIGENLLHGGTGTNTASYAGFSGNVVATLNDDGTGAGTSGNAGTPATYIKDEYIAIHNITGGNGNDLLTGNASSNHLIGGGGSDTLIGGGGNDTLDGGTSTTNNWVSYANVTGTGDIGYIDLSTTVGHATISGADDARLNSHDELRNIQNVIGTQGNDTIIGSSGNNTLEGGAGDDHIYADKGHDIVRAGDGDDTIYVSVDIGNSAATTNNPFPNRFTSVDGGDGNDTLMLGGLTDQLFSLTTLVPGVVSTGSAKVTNIDEINIQDGKSTTFAVDANSINAVVNKGIGSTLVLKHDGDTLSFTLNAGEYVVLNGDTANPITSSTVTSDGLYTIYSAANVELASVQWTT